MLSSLSDGPGSRIIEPSPPASSQLFCVHIQMTHCRHIPDHGRPHQPQGAAAAAPVSRTCGSTGPSRSASHRTPDPARLPGRCHPAFPCRRASSAGIDLAIVVALLFEILLPARLQAQRSTGDAAPSSASASPAPVVPAPYARALAALRARAESRPTSPVAVRLTHLINEDKVPDVPYCLIQNVSGQWTVLVPTKGQARWYKKGDIVQGARILDVNRAAITIEFRGKQATIPPRPWPTLVPTRTQRLQGEWIVYLKTAQSEKAYRRGDLYRETTDEGVREAQIVEITPGSITAVYLAERRLIYSFPQIPCKLTKPSPEGLQVFVETEAGLRPFRTGEKYLDAELVEVLPQQATWRFRDETRAFPTLAYPDLACTGTSKISGVWFAYFEGENQGYRAGQTVRGARIDEIQPGLVKVSFAGIPTEVPATYQSDRH